MSVVLPARGQAGSDPASFVNLNAQVATKLLKKEATPEYPVLAKVNYIQGSVTVQVYVGPNGQVADAHVIDGHPFLAASALKAVRGWIYKPYRVGKKAVGFSTLVQFHFNLRIKPLSPFPPAAEKDLRERITPPEVEKTHNLPSGDHVRMRVLVDSHGRAVDAEVISGQAADIPEAKKEISHWTFRPARWGALAVPWYLVVDVPVRHWPA